MSDSLLDALDRLGQWAYADWIVVAMGPVVAVLFLSISRFRLSWKQAWGVASIVTLVWFVASATTGPATWRDFWATHAMAASLVPSVLLVGAGWAFISEGMTARWRYVMAVGEWRREVSEWRHRVGERADAALSAPTREPFEQEKLLESTLNDVEDLLQWSGARMDPQQVPVPPRRHMKRRQFREQRKYVESARTLHDAAHQSARIAQGHLQRRVGGLVGLPQLATTEDVDWVFAAHTEVGWEVTNFRVQELEGRLTELETTLQNAFHNALADAHLEAERRGESPPAGLEVNRESVPRDEIEFPSFDSHWREADRRPLPMGRPRSDSVVLGP